MKTHGSLKIFILFLTCLPLLSLRAQPTAVEQLQNTRQAQQQQSSLSALAPGTNAPELYPGENADIGPQRILKLTPRPTPFEVFLDSQIFYTNNATFSDNPKTDSMVFVNTLQVTYSPKQYKIGPGLLAPSVGLSSQWYTYGRHSISPLSFNAQTAFIEGKYSFASHWQVFGGVNYTRLLTPHYKESYREFLPNLGVQRLFSIRDDMLFIVSDQVAYHFTYIPSTLGSSPANINNRFDESLNLSFVWQITRQLLAQPYYRFQYSRYRHDTALTSNRNDYLHAAGFTLAYYFNKFASVRTFWNYNYKKSSDHFVPVYHEYDGGLGASLDFKF